MWLNNIENRKIYQVLHFYVICKIEPKLNGINLAVISKHEEFSYAVINFSYNMEGYERSRTIVVLA